MGVAQYSVHGGFRYGSRALELVQRFYEGELADLEADGASDSDQEANQPRAAPTANGGAGCHHIDHDVV